MALPTVLAVMHRSHEDTSATLTSHQVSNPPLQTFWSFPIATHLGRWTLPPQPLNLPIAVDLVVLEHRQLGFLALVLDLLRRGVNFLLPLLGATAQPQNKVKGRLFLDVVVRKGSAVFELLAGEDQALLIRRDAFLVCELMLDVAACEVRNWNTCLEF